MKTTKNIHIGNWMCLLRKTASTELHIFANNPIATVKSNSLGESQFRKEKSSMYHFQVPETLRL